jgi:hypothetical protein
MDKHGEEKNWVKWKGCCKIAVGWNKDDAMSKQG